MRENLFTSNFKALGVRLLKMGLCAVVVSAACLYMGGIYRDSASRNKVNEWNRQRFADFYALPPDSLDLVFIGSSHSYCTFDPEQIDSLLTLSSFQMGMPLQHPDSSYYTLLEIFKTQSPGVVVMEVYWDMLDDPFVLKQADALFQVLRDEDLQKDYIKNVFPTGEKVKYRLPFIRYQQDFLAEKSAEIKTVMQERYGLTIQEERQEGREGYQTKGFIFCDYVITEAKMGRTNQFQGLDGKKWRADPAQEKYLEKIIRLCREQNARLVFVTAPVANASMEIIQNYDAIHEQIARFAAENDVPYLDFNALDERETLLTNEDFRDDAHLNYNGAWIVGAYFAEWLRGE